MSNLRYTLLIYDEDDDSVRHFFDNNFDVRFEKVREAIHFNNFSTLKTFVAQTEQSSEELEMNSLPLNVEIAEKKLQDGSLVIPVRPIPFLGHRPPSEVPTIDLEEEQEREVRSFSTKQLGEGREPQLIENGTSDDFIDVLNGRPEQIHTSDADSNGNFETLVKCRKESVILNEKLVIKLSNDFEEVVQRPSSDVPTTSLEDEEEQEKIRLFKLKMLAKDNIALDNNREEDPQSSGIEHQELHEGVTQIAPLNDVHIMEDDQEKSARISTGKKKTAKRSQVGFGHALIKQNISRRIELGGTRRTSTNETLPPENREVRGVENEEMVEIEGSKDQKKNKKLKRGNESRMMGGMESASKRVAIVRKTSKNTKNKKLLTEKENEENQRKEAKREYAREYMRKYRNKLRNDQTEEGRAKNERRKERERIRYKTYHEKKQEKIRQNLLRDEDKEKIERNKKLAKIKKRNQLQRDMKLAAHEQMNGQENASGNKQVEGMLGNDARV